MSFVQWFSNPYKINSEWIEHIRKVSLFGIAVCSGLSYLYYQYSLFAYGPNDWGSKPFEVLYKGVGVHTLIDFYYSNTYEMKVHHFFILCILFYNEYYQASVEDRFLFTYPMLKTEISTLFYVLNVWLPENTHLHHLNKVIFYISFIKFRVYDYYIDLIQYNTLIHYIIQNYSTKYSSLLYLSIYGLYSLNLYWVFMMNRVIYKILCVSINTDIQCHSWCSLLYLTNMVVALYMYPVYHYECIGTLTQSFLAYLYHQDIYRRLALKKIDEYVAPSKANLLFYIGYIVSLHGRSFFAMLSRYSYCWILIFSIFFHKMSMYHSICHLTEVLTEERKDNFLIIQRRVLAIPFLVDGLWISVHSSRAIPLYLIYLTMIVLHVVNPFYKLTPVAFGVGLIVQTYYFSSIQTY